MPPFVLVESRPLPIEPSLNEKCQHKFLVDIAAISPEQEHLSVDQIVGDFFPVLAMDLKHF